MSKTSAETRGFPLPANINPSQVQICVCVPCDPDHARAFLGQIEMLARWWAWERDTARTGREVAAVWDVIAEDVRTQLRDRGVWSMACGCDDQRIVRQYYGSDGHLHVVYEDDTEAIRDDLDPRFNTPQSPPLPGADGTAKRCDAAASVAYLVQTEFIEKMNDADTSNQLLGLVIAFIALFLSAGALAPLVMVMIFQIIGTGIAATKSAFTSGVWADFKCILDCNMNDDGTVTEAQWQTILDLVDSTFTGIVQVVLHETVNAMGVAGINNAALSGAVTDADCSDCDCEDVWCYEFNFLTDDYGFTVTYGTWVLGQGWVGTTAGSGKSIYLHLAHSMGTITHWEVDVLANPRCNLNFSIGTTQVITANNVLSGTYEWNGSVTDDDITLNPSSGSSQGNSIKLTRMLLRGTGTNPFGTDNCT